MVDKKNVTDLDHNEKVIEKAKDFWSKYQNPVMIAAVAIIVLVGGYYGYKKYFQQPKEEKALDAIFKAEEYYRMDSLQKALNGDGLNLGFVKVVDKFGGTKAGNLAQFYAGDCFLRTGDFNKAVHSFTFFEKSVDAATWYKNKKFTHCHILIKGSRSTAMEKVLE